MAGAGKYRKRPVVIEAMRYSGRYEGDGTPSQVIDWVLSGGGTARFHSEDQGVHINTLEGTMVATPGDWVIRGVQGEYYPCKPGIFAATYEPAEND